MIISSLTKNNFDMKVFVSVCFFLFSMLLASAQAFKSPGEYMSFFGEQNQAISSKYLSYMSESAHGNKVRKLEKKRQELLGTLKAAYTSATRMKPFKGDTSLKKSYVRYMSILNSIFNDDYAKIVNMEEISEQSYDAMEAYMLAKEKADDKLDVAYDKFSMAYYNYAASNKITIIDKEDKQSKKMKKVAAANKYYKVVYLVFFKSNKQEAYLLDAVEKKDVNGIEQNKNTLTKYLTEGFARLDTIKPFLRDQSLTAACRKYFQFIKLESEKLSGVTDYFLKSDEFEKKKKAFETKGSGGKTQEEVKNYNQSIDEMNKQVNNYNSLMQSLNKGRNQGLDYWNAAVKEFFESYTPKN
jgi:hypothetical protein